MKLWLIFIQADDATWLEAALDDESTAQNGSGWEKEVERCRELAHKNGYEMRIVSTEVSGVYELFDAPKLQASPATPQPADHQEGEHRG